MNKTDILNNVTRGLHSVGFKLKAHSPEILVVTGVVGVVASAVMACKATTKINPIIEHTKMTADAIREGAEKGEAPCNLEDGTVGVAPYSEENAKKDLAITYARSGMEFVKLYGPSVLLGAVSIGCILGGHRILNKRNAALTAAYAAVDRGFKQYRGRVVERFGEELDRELRYNIKAEQVEKTVTNEDGTESTVTETVKTIDTRGSNNYSEFARCFDDGNRGWSKDPHATKFFLLQQQNFASEKLKSRGYLFLNEVYEMLDIPVCDYGGTVGWVYDENNTTLSNYVDFGIFDSNKKQCVDFVNGSEKTLWLDFNIDGNVYELMRERDGLRFPRKR